jgi:HAE1 family hydrophobic/amphiphilic exporter-1
MESPLFKKILDNEIAVVLIFIFIMALGIFSFSTIKVTFMPRHTDPVLTVITEYYGMEPDLIEDIITRPIENILKEINGIKNIYSFSARGRSKIIVYLDQKEDADRKAVIIKDKIQHISARFPAEVREPAVYRYNTEDRPVMIIALSSETQDIDELSIYAENLLKPELLSVDGVANIELSGSFKEEYIIEQKYGNITRLKGDYEDVFEGIVKNNISTPPGNFKDENAMYTVKFPNRYVDLMALPEYPVLIGKNLVEGSEIFSVKKQLREDDKISLINNEPALTVYIFKKDFSNILEIETGVIRALKKWEDLFEYRYVYNQSDGFRDLLLQLEIGVAAAVLCIFIIVLLFYRKFSLSFMTIATIPICFAGTLLFLKLFSRSLNIMTLSGIIVGTGASVDNTLIMLESVRGNLRTKTVDNALLKSMKEVNRSLLSATLTTVVVFIPLFFIDRSKVSLYADFALSVSTMLIMSYLIAIYFVPAFIKRFLFKTRVFEYSVHGNREFGAIYRFVVGNVISRPVFTLGAFLLLTGGFVYFFAALNYKDVSPLKNNRFEFFYEFDPGYTTGYKKQVMEKIGRYALERRNQNVTLVSKLEGNRASFFLNYPEGEKPGGEKDTESEKGSFKDHLLNLRRDDGFVFFQEGSESGIKSINLLFFGDDLEKLDVFVDSVNSRLSGFFGVSQVLKGYKPGQPEIRLSVDTEKMFYNGLNLSDVIRLLRYFFYYPVIMKYYDGENIVDVRGKIGFDNPGKDEILSLMVPISAHYSGSGNAPGPGPKNIRLGDFTSLSYSEGIGTISRKNGKRFIPVDIIYEGVTEDELLNRTRVFLKSIRFEKDFYYEIDEKIVERRKSRARLLYTLSLAIFLVYVVLGIILKSFRKPLIIILTVPSIFAGAFLFLLVSGYGRSVPVNIALIMLTGLSVNSIVLLLEEVLLFRGEGALKALLIGYRRKMRIMLMTVLTTSFSVIPVFLLSTSTYFFKILTGVIFCGLLSSLLLSLLIFPVMYNIFTAEKFE